VVIEMNVIQMNHKFSEINRPEQKEIFPCFMEKVPIFDLYKPIVMSTTSVERQQGRIDKKELLRNY
jgi:hypothetical protein